jgi:hypothetical protein
LACVCFDSVVLPSAAPSAPRAITLAGAAGSDTVLGRASLDELWRPPLANTTNDADSARSEAGFRAIRDAALQLIAR